MSEHENKQGSKGLLSLSLIVAFLPSAFAIGTFAFAGNAPPILLLVAVCVLAVVCCFASAYVLKRSNSGHALLLGLLLLLLNMVISLFFGCGALVASQSVH